MFPILRLFLTVQIYLDCFLKLIFQLKVGLLTLLVLAMYLFAA